MFSTSRALQIILGAAPQQGMRATVAVVTYYMGAEPIASSVFGCEDTVEVQKLLFPGAQTTRKKKDPT